MNPQKSQLPLPKVIPACLTTCPGLLIDGEMQLDSALDPEVAGRKISGESPVAGKANVLVFPDLNSGNFAYKLARHLTGATAIGTALQSESAVRAASTLLR